MLSSGSNFTRKHINIYIIYSFYICQKSRLYVKVKIVFEANKDPTYTFFFQYLSHILHCDLKTVSLTTLKL